MDKPGRVVLVDLTQGERISLPYPPSWTRAYLAGRGINIRLLMEHTRPGTGPLDPDSVLILSCGLLTGTAAPASSRLHLSAPSPLTGLLGSSSVGGISEPICATKASRPSSSAARASARPPTDRKERCADRIR